MNVLLIESSGAIQLCIAQHYFYEICELANFNNIEIEITKSNADHTMIISGEQHFILALIYILTTRYTVTTLY